MFLVAGALLLVTGIVEVIDPYVAASLQGPGGIVGFGGTVLSFVGLLGLYPRLVRGNRNLARTGIGLLSLPVLFVLVLFVWSLSAAFLPLPSLTAMIPGGGVVLMGVFILFGAGTATFGVVSLQSTPLSRNVGLLLFVLAASWLVLLGGAVVYGQIPAWVLLGDSVMKAFALIGIGYLLRVGTTPGERTEPASDSPA